MPSNSRDFGADGITSLAQVVHEGFELATASGSAEKN